MRPHPAAAASSPLSGWEAEMLFLARALCPGAGSGADFCVGADGGTSALAFGGGTLC